jgi:hypothetical protein
MSGCWFKVSRKGDVNVFAKDARKASKIHGVINPGKCRPK